MIRGYINQWRKSEESPRLPSKPRSLSASSSSLCRPDPAVSGKDAVRERYKTLDSTRPRLGHHHSGKNMCILTRWYFRFTVTEWRSERDSGEHHSQCPVRHEYILRLDQINWLPEIATPNNAIERSHVQKAPDSGNPGTNESALCVRLYPLPWHISPTHCANARGVFLGADFLHPGLKTSQTVT